MTKNQHPDCIQAIYYNKTQQSTIRKTAIGLFYHKKYNQKLHQVLLILMFTALKYPLLKF